MRAVLVGVALLVLSGSANAQSPLVGAWEGTTTTISSREEVPCHLIYTADGHYSWLCVPANRPKIKDFTGDAKDLPKDELVRLFDDVTAQFGTYTIAGHKVTEKIVAAKFPNAEGLEDLVTWRLDKGELVLTGRRTVGRYHRAK